MPLTILVPMIAVGLPLVIVLVWWVNREQEHVMLSSELASKRFLEDFPSQKVADVILSNDSQTAILTIENQSAVGLVYPVGNHYLTRLLLKDDILSIENTTTGVLLKLADFTLGSISFETKNGEVRSILHSSLNQASFI